MPAETFVHALATRVTRRLVEAGLEADDDAVAESIARAHASDLFVVLAADAGDERAWERVTAANLPLLTGTLVRRGVPRAEAEAIVADLLGDLAAPPPSGESRTLLGTYAGTAALAGWLCVIVLRRWSASRRRRTPSSLEAAEGGQRVVGRAREASDADPASRSVEAEAARGLAAAFDAAWARLEPRERLVLVAKYADGHSQAEIARALRTSEATTSRIVAQALSKLRDFAPPAPPDLSDPGLAGLLAGRLARAAACAPGPWTTSAPGAQAEPGSQPKRRSTP